MNQSTGHVVSMRGDIVEVEFNVEKPSRLELLTLEEDKKVRLEVYSSTLHNTVLCFFSIRFFEALSRCKSRKAGKKFRSTCGRPTSWKSC